MVSHKISISLLMRIFHIFNFQAITYSIDGFIAGKKSQSIVYLQEEVSIYIGFWALKLRCTQWSFVVNAAFKNARPIFLLGGAANDYGWVQKKLFLRLSNKYPKLLL